MELSDHEIKQWCTPEDFLIGKTVFIYNRPFLIYDMDEFTRAWMHNKYGLQDFTPVEVSGPAKRLPTMVRGKRWTRRILVPWRILFFKNVKTCSFD